jgi:GNAT superfamily N-acetyltransferase
VTGYAVGDLRPVHRDAVYRFLSQDAYWSEGLPRDVFDRSIENSLNFAAVAGEKVVGFARVVTDRATFAWLCDVFVLAEHRGKGVSKLLMDAVMAHRDLARVRNFMLATRDAHGLYAKYGFAPLAEPGRWMAIRRPYR